MIAEEQQYKRNIAYKLLIGDILKAKPIFGESDFGVGGSGFSGGSVNEVIKSSGGNENVENKDGVGSGDGQKQEQSQVQKRLLFLELGDRKIVRVHLIANVVDKFASEGDKKYASITLDDASGQIRVKAFGDDTVLLKDVSQGDTLRIIGNVREYNDELYILPEIAKRIDPKWLLVRKLEIQKLRKDIPAVQEGNAPLRDVLLEKIKGSEEGGGIDVDEIIMKTEASPDLINQEIKKLLEEGLIYEPRPGRLRYLG